MLLPKMQCAGSFLLSIVLAATPAAAAVTEIPAKYLEQEARIRRAMSPQARVRVDGLTARLNVKMTVADVKNLTRDEPAASIFVVMIEYLKLLQKDAREDRKIARSDAASNLRLKASKLDLEKEKIEAQKREAQERFDRAMEAANLAMWLGIISGAAGSVGPVSGATKTPTKVPRLPTEAKIH